MLETSVQAAASQWGYRPPDADFFDVFGVRIPAETRAEIGRGVTDGRVVVDGYRFTLPALGPKKGPYAFYSKNRGPMVPSPNWEYFVQLAEYLRIQRTTPSEYRIGFEDGLMDVSVRSGAGLVWYIEAKERASQAERLIGALGLHAPRVDVEKADRGNDPLRKAKYLIRHRPPYFSVVAIAWRRDYAIAYPTGDAFKLQPLDRTPLLSGEASARG